jgi:hypothetical protein
MLLKRTMFDAAGECRDSLLQDDNAPIIENLEDFKGTLALSLNGDRTLHRPYAA